MTDEVGASVSGEAAGECAGARQAVGQAALLGQALLRGEAFLATPQHQLCSEGAVVAVTVGLVCDRS